MLNIQFAALLIGASILSAIFVVYSILSSHGSKKARLKKRGKLYTKIFLKVLVEVLQPRHKNRVSQIIRVSPFL